MTKPVEFLFRLYATLAGLLLGLFLGLVLFGSFFRVLLDILFAYGDSGPPWVGSIIILFTLVFTILCIWISNKWMNSYIDQKKKLTPPF